MGIGPRLLAVASLVPKGSSVGDIGTDHGYLPIHLVEAGIIPRGVAGDVNQGPLNSARSSIGAAGLRDVIDTRLGSGLTVLKPGEVDVAIMCGMGGSLMVELLKEAPEVVKELKGLILQPQQGWAGLRQYLYEIKWHIQEEILVEEDKRLYQIIYAVPGEEELPSAMELQFGPINMAKRPPLFTRLVKEEWEKVQRRLKGMECSAEAKASTAYEEAKAYGKALEELL